MILRYLFLILMMFQCTLCWAQSALKVQIYSTQDKISQSKISHFVQDDNGFLWFGAWDGLMRFDGHETQLYKTYPGDSVHIENHRVMRLLKSKQGNLWVTFYGKRCYVFDPQQNRYCNPLAPYGNEIEQLYPLDNGVIWAYKTQHKFLRIEEQGANWRITEVCLPFDFGKLNNIRLDSKNNEWVLTDKGAFIYNLNKKISDLPFWHLVSIHENTFLATREQIYSYSSDSDSLKNLSLKFPAEIDEMSVLHNGSILLRQRQQISLYSPVSDEFKTYPFNAAILRYTFEDSKHRLWMLGNEDEIFVLENGKLRTIPYHGQRVESTTAAFQYAFEDDYGTIWVQPGGSLPLAFYDSKKDRLEQAYTHKDGRRQRIQAYIRSGALDDRHNLWGNIDEVGFCHFSFSRQEYGFVGDIEGDQVGLTARAMILDHSKRLWVGWRKDTKSDEGAIALYDDKQQLLGYISHEGRLVQHLQSALQVNVNALMQDRRGRMWVGSRTRGLYLLVPTDEEATTFSIHHYEKAHLNPRSIGGNNVHDILEDHQGRIWLANYGNGLDLVDESQGVNHLTFKHASGIPTQHGYIRSLCETRDHRLLIGQNNGLLVADLEQDSLVFYLNQCNKQEYSLSSNSVTHINELQDGRIAISTFGGGINLLPSGFALSDTLHFQHYDAHHGKVEDVVWATIQDKEGALWILSENGLRKYNSNFEPLETYLKETACSEAIPAADTLNNFLYLASRNEVLCILQKEVRQSRFEPQLAFSSLSIHRNDSTSTLLALNPADSILSFDADDRNFTLQFIALDYVDQSSIQYAYRIRGKSEQWVPLQDIHTVHVADLPGGEYTLEVRCTNDDGFWSSHIASLHFTIEPYFYEALWFRILMWTFFIAFIAISIYLYLHYMEGKKKAEMESQLTDAKVKFFTGVSQKKDPAEEQFIKELIDVLEQNLQNEDFSIEQAAVSLGISYTVLYRKVKSLMDITPVELMRQMRIQKAQKLLIDQPDMAISEIAYACGFSTPQYFNRVFKDQSLCTPVEYRKQQKKDSKKE